MKTWVHRPVKNHPGVQKTRKTSNTVGQKSRYPRRDSKDCHAVPTELQRQQILKRLCAQQTYKYDHSNNPAASFLSRSSIQMNKNKNRFNCVLLCTLTGRGSNRGKLPTKCGTNKSEKPLNQQQRKCIFLTKEKQIQQEWLIWVTTRCREMNDSIKHKIIQNHIK
jgi:hypothetical protein